MAKAIATITGTALRPGVSKNRRWYKPEHVAGAVEAAQKRIAAGAAPMVMLTFHEAGDNSREIAASLESMTLAGDGSADFTASFTDTPAGWDIARLADTSDGKPAHLKNVSIRGMWLGKVRKERGPDGQLAETADGLELDGIDFTKAPGVEGAEIKTFAWAAGGQNETDGRVLITESVEGTVEVTETAEAGTGASATGPAGAPDGARETLRLVLGAPAPHVLDNGLCVTCAAVGESGTPAMSKRSSGLSGTGGPYADPGYQADKKQRYQLDTKDHAVAAWRFISKASYAAKYTAAQLKRVKGRIKAALRKFGVNVSTESAGWTFDEPYQVSESVQEWYGDDPKRAGSWCVSASNGPVNMNMSSYSMDPADLDVILRAAADAACKALAALDPDMDGDVDVDGVGSNSDTDDDSGSESAPAESEPAPAGETDPAPAGTEEGDPAMAEETTTTSETGGAALTLSDVKEAATAAATAALEAYDKAREEREAATAKETAIEGTDKNGEGTVSETEDQRIERIVAGRLAAAGVKPPVQETEEERVQRLVAEGLAAAGVKAPVEETEDDRIARIVSERVQGLVADGSVIVQRTGILQEHTAPTADTAKTAKELAAMSEDEAQEYMGAALDKYLGDRSSRIQPVHT